MKRATRNPARPQPSLLAERVAWIDRVVRAIDAEPQPPMGLVHECRELRSALCTFRDGLMLGSRLAETQRKLK